MTGHLFFSSNVNLGGDYMISFCWEKISIGKPGHTSPYNYTGKLNFIPARRDSFPPDICLQKL